MLAQVPPSLREGTIVLVLILVAIFIGTGVLCFVWACLIVWPPERRRLMAAAEVRRLGDLPLGGDRRVPRPLPLIAGGLLLGGLLWTVLSTLGLFGAPLLWVTVSALYLGTAWRMREMERRQRVTYYEVPAASLFTGQRHLFVLHTL